LPFDAENDELLAGFRQDDQLVEGLYRHHRLRPDAGHSTQALEIVRRLRKAIGAVTGGAPQATACQQVLFGGYVLGVVTGKAVDVARPANHKHRLGTRPAGDKPGLVLHRHQ
jgi:hypothetical protein